MLKIWSHCYILWNKQENSLTLVPESRRLVTFWFRTGNPKYVTEDHLFTR